MTADGFAPAKINLTLHVTGQRDDGYHLLDSLVGFADVGDQISVAASETLSLTVVGPMAKGVPQDTSNLVLQAARLLDPHQTAAITLDKHLPPAAGLGGGSSDAAAALRILARHWSRPMPTEPEVLALGADVPVCLAPGAQRLCGIGDVLTPLPALPSCAAILINPGFAVPTPAVFKALATRDNAAMSPVLPQWRDGAELASWLHGQRNDLLLPALALQPMIGQVLAALQRQGCLFAGMSGSGATCFAIMVDTAARDRAAAALQQAQPAWWVAPCTLG